MTARTREWVGSAALAVAWFAAGWVIRPLFVEPSPGQCGELAAEIACEERVAAADFREACDASEWCLKADALGDIVHEFTYRERGFAFLGGNAQHEVQIWIGAGDHRTFFRAKSSTLDGASRGAVEDFEALRPLLCGPSCDEEEGE